MAKVTRKGSGKTKGAGSFVQVRLSEINRMFNHTKEHPNDAALILVSRRFAEMVGLEADDFVATTKNVEAHGGRIEFTINK